MLKRISLEDIPIIGGFTAGFEPFSDFNAISLYCWNSQNNNMYEINDGIMTIKITDYLKNRSVYSVLGDSVSREYIDELLSKNVRLRMVPEFIALKLKNYYTIEEDRDNFDYILDLGEFSELDGHNYKVLRKRIRKFKRLYPRIKVEELDLRSNSVRREIISMTEMWGETKRFNREKIKDDVDNINRYFEAIEMVVTHNFSMYDKGKIIGYSMNQALDQNWVMGLFGCTDTSYINSALALEHEVAEILHSKGYRYINIQQDTGIQGLRNSKLSYRPVRFLKKYNISRPKHSVI